jgi:hypothetical protein
MQVVLRDLGVQRGFHTNVCVNSAVGDKRNQQKKTWSWSTVLKPPFLKHF